MSQPPFLSLWFLFALSLCDVPNDTLSLSLTLLLSRSLFVSLSLAPSSSVFRSPLSLSYSLTLCIVSTSFDISGINSGTAHTAIKASIRYVPNTILPDCMGSARNNTVTQKDRILCWHTQTHYLSATLLCLKHPRNLPVWPCFMVEYLQLHICMEPLLSFKPLPARLDMLYVEKHSYNTLYGWSFIMKTSNTFTVQTLFYVVKHSFNTLYGCTFKLKTSNSFSV